MTRIKERIHGLIDQINAPLPPLGIPTPEASERAIAMVDPELITAFVDENLLAVQAMLAQASTEAGDTHQIDNV